MRKNIFPLFTLAALISLFAFGVLVVQAQEQPKTDTPEKKENGDKETDKKDIDQELKDKVTKLIEQLGSADFNEREKAKQELIKLGKDIIPYLNEALKNTEDLEVKSKLTEILNEFKKTEENLEDDAQGPRRIPSTKSYKLKLEFKPGIRKMISLPDSTGLYKYEKYDNGSVRVTALPNGGKEEVREYKSDAEFKKNWPEIYAKFKDHLEPKKPETDDDDNDTQPWGDNPQEDLDDDDDDDGFGLQNPQPMPEDLQKEIERLKKDLEQRFKKDFNKEANPFGGNKGFSQYYRSTRTDEEGNTYVLTIQDGKVKAEFKAKDGTSTVKEYNSYEEFKKDWPDFAELFPHVDSEYKPFSSPKKVEEDRLEDAVLEKLSTVLKEQLQLKDGEGLIITKLVGHLDDNPGFFKKAGLERSDIIYSINGETVTSFDFIKEKYASIKEGETITLQIFRESKKQEIAITK